MFFNLVILMNIVRNVSFLRRECGYFFKIFAVFLISKIKLRTTSMPATETKSRTVPFSRDIVINASAPIVILIKTRKLSKTGVRKIAVLLFFNSNIPVINTPGRKKDKSRTCTGFVNSPVFERFCEG